ncbi:MAG: ATP-binding cassette domain-containing protein [Bdellovibrionaceae bacterium]|nr:ATP-binding cassette domain-containing protein [Pseudobdellovibrionaceae bacterium]
MKSPVLELIKVSVHMGGELILEDVQLEVYQDDTIVIIGQSGSGKSVLLKMMAGVYPADEGIIRCHGREWKTLSDEERHSLARKIGVQFQKSALFDNLDAYDNVAFPLREHTSMSEAEIETRVLECLRAVGLEEAKHLAPHKMSGGMQQRLGIARAIALKPEILFLDDPTAGLDPVNADNMSEMILNLKKEVKTTLVVATHDIQRAYQFAGRIFLLANKHVIECGSATETQNSTDSRVQQFIHGWLKGPLTSNSENNKG